MSVKRGHKFDSGKIKKTPPITMRDLHGESKKNIAL